MHNVSYGFRISDWRSFPKLRRFFFFGFSFFCVGIAYSGIFTPAFLLWVIFKKLVFILRTFRNFPLNPMLKFHSNGLWCGSLFIYWAGHSQSFCNLNIHILQFWEIFFKQSFDNFLLLPLWNSYTMLSLSSASSSSCMLHLLVAPGLSSWSLSLSTLAPTAIFSRLNKQLPKVSSGHILSSVILHSQMSRGSW